MFANDGSQWVCGGDQIPLKLTILSLWIVWKERKRGQDGPFLKWKSSKQNFCTTYTSMTYTIKTDTNMTNTSMTSTIKTYTSMTYVWKAGWPLNVSFPFTLGGVWASPGPSCFASRGAGKMILLSSSLYGVKEHIVNTILNWNSLLDILLTQSSERIGLFQNNVIQYERDNSRPLFNTVDS